MKWEPVAAMIALLLLGMWVVYSPQIRHTLPPGAVTTRFVLGGSKGELVMIPSPGPPPARSFQFYPNRGTPSRPLTEHEFRDMVGPTVADDAIALLGSRVFRALNVTGWGSLVWLVVGFAGQMLFFGRMMVQWVASERAGRSHVPESFWWFSLLGGGHALHLFRVAPGPGGRPGADQRRGDLRPEPAAYSQAQAPRDARFRDSSDGMTGVGRAARR